MATDVNMPPSGQFSTPVSSPGHVFKQKNKNSLALRKLGISEVLLGAVVIMLGFTTLAWYKSDPFGTDNFSMDLFPGIWCGIFPILSGTYVSRVCHRKEFSDLEHKINVVLVILSCIMMIALMLISSIVAALSIGSTRMIYVFTDLFAVVLLMICVVHFSFSSCKKKRAPHRVAHMPNQTAPAAQYVANGQYMLLQNPVDTSQPYPVAPIQPQPVIQAQMPPQLLMQAPTHPQITMQVPFQSQVGTQAPIYPQIAMQAPVQSQVTIQAPVQASSPTTAPQNEPSADPAKEIQPNDVVLPSGETDPILPTYSSLND